MSGEVSWESLSRRALQICVIFATATQQRPRTSVVFPFATLCLADFSTPQKLVPERSQSLRSAVTRCWQQGSRSHLPQHSRFPLFNHIQAKADFARSGYTGCRGYSHCVELSCSWSDGSRQPQAARLGYRMAGAQDAGWKRPLCCQRYPSGQVSLIKGLGSAARWLRALIRLQIRILLTQGLGFELGSAGTP